MKRSLCAVLAGCLLPAIPAFAGDSAHDSFWSVASPEADAYDEQMALGDELAFAAGMPQRHDFGNERLLQQQYALRAITAYEEALVARPKASDPNRRILALLEDILLVPPPGRTPTDVPRVFMEKAIDNIEALEKKSPGDPRFDHYYFFRAIQYTKLAGNENLLKAVEDYKRSLKLVDTSSAAGRRASAPHLGNLAEVYMMLGDLPNAIAYYEEAVDAEFSVTIGYGLAVALDRDHQGVRAREVARKYAEADAQNRLHDGGSFFVPDAEIFYYDAIRFEGLGQTARAIVAYQYFVDALPHSPWAKRANENIETLKSQLGGTKTLRKLRAQRDFIKLFED